MWLGTKHFNGESYYNYEELNRVEENTKFLYSALGLSEALFDVSRTIDSIECVESLNRIEDNLENITIEFHRPLEWIPSKRNWKSGDSFSYIDANRLETNLSNLFRLYQSHVLFARYCGCITCGGDLIE